MGKSFPGLTRTTKKLFYPPSPNPCSNETERTSQPTHNCLSDVPQFLLILEYLGLKRFFSGYLTQIPLSRSKYPIGRLAKFLWEQRSILETWTPEKSRNMTMWPFVCLAKSVCICFYVPMWACVYVCQCVCVMKRTSVHKSVGKQIFESHRPPHPGWLCLLFGCHDSCRGLCMGKQSSGCVLKQEERSGARESHRSQSSPQSGSYHSRPTRMPSSLSRLM